MTIELDLKPDVEAIIKAQAQARGVSVEAYIASLIESMNGFHNDAGAAEASRNGQPQTEAVNMAEIDQWLDELSEGTEHNTPLPADFSRVDIYGEHP